MCYRPRRLFLFAEENRCAGEHGDCGQYGGNCGAGGGVDLNACLRLFGSVDMNDLSTLAEAANGAVVLGHYLAVTENILPLGEGMSTDVGQLAAVAAFLPMLLAIINPSAVVAVVELCKHNIFSLSFCPICIELSGVSALAVCKAGSGGDFRIGDGCFIGFHMACIALAHAFSGALIATLSLFPLIGGAFQS